jgi:hypothetical protein
LRCTKIIQAKPDEIGRAMPTVDELLKLAKDQYAKARSTPDPEAKLRLVQLGNQYLKEAVHDPRSKWIRGGSSHSSN